MNIREQIMQWEQLIEHIRETDRASHEKNMKKIKELQEKINRAKVQKDREDERFLGELVRTMVGELNEDTMEQVRQMLSKYGHTADGMDERGGS